MHIVVTFLAVLELMKTGHDPCLSGRILAGDPDRFPDITEHKSMSGETGRKEKEWKQKKLTGSHRSNFVCNGRLCGAEKNLHRRSDMTKKRQKK